MGEIADSMINGEMCEMCGVPLDGEAAGYPRYCSVECADDRGADHSQVVEGYDDYDDTGIDPDDTEVL